MNLNEDVLGCNPTRFMSGRNGFTIVGVVVHTMVGTWESADALFQSDGGGNPTSAHIGIPCDQSINIKRWVADRDTAYADGNFTENEMYLSVECEDLGHPFDPRPDSLYERVAAKIADWSAIYGFPINSTTIVRHRDVPGATTSCPDTLDVERIISEAQNPKSGEEMANYSKSDANVDTLYGEGYSGQPGPYKNRDLFAAVRCVDTGTFTVTFRGDDGTETPTSKTLNPKERFAVKAPGTGGFDVEVSGTGAFVARIYEELL